MATVAAVVASGAAVVLTAPTASAAAAPCADGTTPALLDSVSCTTAGSYTLGVPAGTTDIDVAVVGAGGGAGYPARSHIGGNAAQVTGQLSLPPGTASLHVIVGAPGGGNNNGRGYGGGGSGIFALDSDSNLLAKLVIAGAGGGGAYNGDGGNAGSAGTSENSALAAPGQPGTGPSGGAGGPGNYSSGTPGGSDNPTALTIAGGGAGGTYPNNSAGGSGGGGYGGGGGGASGNQGILNIYQAGGGGGSSLASAYLASASIAVKAGTGGTQLPGLVAGDGAAGSVTMVFNGVAVPGAPTDVTAQAGDAEATVSFTAPTSNGGSTITTYTVTASPGGASATCTSSPCTVTGLDNGTAYTFTVVATNAVDDSPESAPSSAVTPSGVPGAPTDVTAQAGDGEATVSFTAPTSNGGSTITTYTVTANPGGATATCPSSPCTVTGLDNGTAYTFTAVAINENGDSSESTQSEAVTPSTPVEEWYRHPMTRAERQELARVPAHPRRSTGPARTTKAMFRTHDGTLAVPARRAHGHQLAAGQGVQLLGLFRSDSARLTPAGRQKLVALTRSMDHVRALTCEGYADYGSSSRNKQRLSAKRAQKVCAVLERRLDVRTSTVGYGPQRPAMIGGKVADRAFNRRVALLVRR